MRADERDPALTTRTSHRTMRGLVGLPPEHEVQMVNRGDGGARRPVPPSARPAPKAARPAGDDDNERTNAINLADMNLDDLDEVPVPAAPPPRAAPPAAKAPLKKLGSRSFEDDDGSEKTNAINLADINLDEIDDLPAPAPAARPQPVAPGRPAPGRAPAPAPAPRAAPPAPAARPQPGRPSANADDVERAMRDPGPAPRAPVKPAAPAPAPAPVKAAAAPPKKEEPVYEKTQAVSLEELESTKKKLLAARAAKEHKEPPAADRTYLVDDEDVPVVKAPAAKKMAGKAAEDASAAPMDAEPSMVVRGGPDVGKSFPLTKDLTLVGRGLDADVVINDASASRKHFNIVRTLSGWKLVDLGSGNGTKVDGNRVTELQMKHGMRIEAGGTTMEWVHDGTPASPGAAASGKPAPPRETARDDAPPPARAPTGMAPVMNDDAKAARRGPQDDKGPQERKRDASRLDKFDDKDDAPKAKGGAKPPPPNEEKTSFGDIQALEIDPEWEARRLKQRREGVAEAGSTEAEDGDDGRKKGGGVGKKIAIVAVIIGVLGGGFVAADKFAGLGIIFPKEVTIAEPTPDEKKPEAPEDKVVDKDPEDKDPEDKDPEDKDPEDKPEDKPGDKPEDKPANADAAKPKEDAKAKVAEAAQAAKDKRFIAARDLYVAALKLDDLVDGGDAGLAQVENELKASATIHLALKAMDEQKWSDAAKALEDIKEASANYAAAQDLAKIAKDGAVVEQLAKASELFAKKDLAGAKAAVADALKNAGDYAEGSALKDAIERAGAPDAELTELDPADPNAKNPPKAAPADLKPGLDAYAKGDFQAVANAFDGIVYGGTASRQDVAKAKAWGAAATTFDEAMKQVAANVGKPDEQLGYLRSARRADAILGGAQKAKVATELAKVWGAIAKKSLETNAGLAGFQAKLALTFDPAAADAKAVQADATKEAKAWVNDAKGLKDAPDKAADLYTRALRVLPKDDPDYTAADSALAALLKPTE